MVESPWTAHPVSAHVQCLSCQVCHINMDSSLLKSMLESQEQAYKSAMELLVKKMNNHMKQLEGNVTELTISLEFTQREVDDLKSLDKNHEEEKKDAKMLKIDNLTEQVELSKRKMKELEERINYPDAASRTRDGASP